MKILKNKNFLLSVIIIILIPVSCLLLYSFKDDYQTKLTLSEEDARAYATDAIELLEKKSKDWTVLSAQMTSSPETIMGSRFIWQTKPKNIYKQFIGSYISDSFWKIRFLLFKGKPDERAEEYAVFINNEGIITRIQRKFSNKKSLPSLSKPVARGLALETIEKLYKITPYDLKEISVTESEFLDRTDYIFTFQDLTYANNENSIDTRIVVCLAGNIITDFYRYIEPPQAWMIKEQKSELYLYYFTIFNILLLIFCVIIVCTKTIQSFFSLFFLRSFLVWFIPIFLLATFYFLNIFPSFTFNFSSTESFEKQRNIIFISGMIGIMCITFFLNFYISQLKNYISNKNNYSFNQIILYGFSIGTLTSFFILIHDLFFQSYKPFHLTLFTYSYFSEWFNFISESLLLFFIIGSLSLILTTFFSTLSKNKALFFSACFIITGLNTLLYFFNTPTIISYLITGPLLSIILYAFISFFKITIPLISIPAAACITFFLLIKHTMHSFDFFSISIIFMLIIWTLLWTNNEYKSIKKIKN